MNPEDDPKGMLQSLLSGYRRIRENPLGDIAMGFTPAGVVADVEDAGRAIRDRDLVGLGLAGIGFVPGVGDVAKGAGKAIRRAVSDLPMDEASRLARAREMGFDVNKPMYHGTYEDFDEFRPSSDGMLGPGVYLTSAPEEASQYAQMIANPLSNRFVSEHKRGSLAPNVVPVFTRIEKPFDLPSMSYEDEYLPAMLRNAGINLPSSATKADAVKELLDRGYDAVRVRDIYDGMFEFPTSNVNVLNPNQIRSQFARFDPTQRESANLLAGLAGLFGAGTAARMMNQNREER